MSYREHAPPPALAPWLECIWERYADGAEPVRVLPDGCIDVVWIEDAGTQLVGANTTAFFVSLTAGTRAVGARVRPGAAPSLLAVAGDRVRDARIPLAQVWGDEGACLAAALDESADPAVCLRAALVARATRADRPDPLVSIAVTALGRPAVAIEKLAGELGLSERQLRRRVSRAVGYGPKRLARVLRFGQALAAARRGEGLAQVAYESGYADQAHFTNDCRALAGVPPLALLAA